MSNILNMRCAIWEGDGDGVDGLRLRCKRRRDVIRGGGVCGKVGRGGGASGIAQQLLPTHCLLWKAKLVMRIGHRAYGEGGGGR